MLIKIYEQMLIVASKCNTPKYITMVFHFDIDSTKQFWEKENEKEHDMLWSEWEPLPHTSGDDKSRYAKTLYGVKFIIQFNYAKKS